MKWCPVFPSVCLWLIILITASRAKDVEEPLFSRETMKSKQQNERRRLYTTEQNHYFTVVHDERKRIDPGNNTPALKILQSIFEKKNPQKGKYPTFLVPKTHLNNTHTRLLFVAGIEGSGHHAIKDALSSCFTNNFCRPVQFSRDLSYYSDVPHGLFGGFDTLYHDDHLENLYAHMQEFAYRTQSPADNSSIPKAFHIPAPYGPGRYYTQDYQHGHLPGLYVIGLDTFPLSMMMSYPNGDGPTSKPVDHPDLVTMAALADAAGIDFRILVLNRPSYSTLYSTLQRGFGHGIEPLILPDNAHMLTVQLQQLDPHFYLCLEYEDLASYMRPESNSSIHGASDLNSSKENNPDRLQYIGEFLHSQFTMPTLRKMWERLKPKQHVSLAASSRPESSLNKNLAITSRETRNMKRRQLTKTDDTINRLGYSQWRLKLALENMRSVCHMHHRHIDNLHEM